MTWIAPGSQAADVRDSQRRALASATLSSLVAVWGAEQAHAARPDGKTLADTTALAASAVDLGVSGAPLLPCTQEGDAGTTGWTRTGSCEWDSSDKGYHQVCVTMSSTFLSSSAQADKNDLRSVVGPGGRWCICAWAWASAVSRDPDSFEGFSLDCDRTNGRLRNAYRSFMDSGRDLVAPSGARYPAEAALKAVEAVCG
eukprot:CAMPEP_0183597144 /NCGR_PEP_ID=MMETSP0371-20130417/176389_1 /TAXON_ID=268820 /ORGANISM="Peridinium aciculiferum, Strain PAER-2" /LENGTH=198 /DNA_ID=CAMNT_0025809075 /DNA_START=14 /DNA_END=610 /DNA_ORIENTATION=-